MSIALQRLPGPFGVEVVGFDPDSASAGDRASLRHAFLEHGVLLLRGLDLPPEQHVELTRVFGTPAIHPIPSIRMPGHPEIIVLAVDLSDSLEPDDPTADEVIGRIPWHTDLTYTPTPSKGALLLAREVPPELGETGYIDTAAVYDALPEPLRRRIEGLRALHSLGDIASPLRRARGPDPRGGERDAEPVPSFEPSSHPLVHRHPETGRRVLNVSPAFAKAIEGLDPASGDALLEELQAFATQDRFAYHHRWQVGDLIVWDNRRTMHTAAGHRKKHRRRMHRTTLAGDG